MKKILLTFLGMICFYHPAHSQKQNNIWYFGVHAGVDFATGSPIPIGNGQIDTWEGSAILSDTSGNLMFYTDGLTVWNRTHNVMPNGSGLLGNSSSTQAAMIIPLPGSMSQFIIFTTDALAGTNGCEYSVVDMNANGGLGDVTIKNVLLHTPTTEKLTACKNSNGTDYWVITHPLNTDAFNVYPVTSSGVGSPVISNVGSTHTGPSCYGQMTYSCLKNKVALIVNNTNTIDLLDFDPATGLLSNPIIINSFPGLINGLYGLAFSPSGELLYATDLLPGVLFQFDITSGVASTINNSSTLIGNAYALGAIQLAPDNKLYIADFNLTAIAVINNPDIPGISCGFVDSALNVNNTVNLGLPNFPVCAYPTMLQANFTSANLICPGTCVDFTNLSANASSYQWSFPGANPDTSSAVNPVNVCYNTSGSYDVQLIASNANGTDTLLISSYITVYPQPPPQGIMKSGDTLFANPGATSYQWYFNGSIITGATEYFYVATASGDYNVVATDDNGCEVEAVINDVIAGLTPPLSRREGVVIFPNPAEEKFTMNNSQFTPDSYRDATTKEVSIYNMIGEIVMAIVLEPDQSTIDCHTLPPGMYSIEIISGENIYRTKFVKQ